MHFNDIITTLRERREALRVTQEMLAELSGVGLRTIKELESGQGNPTLGTMQKLTNVLGLEITLQVRKPEGLS